jgi:hypothetical protein
MSEPMVALAFGGAADDEEAQAFARKALHDQLIEAHPVRLGPVVWRTYEGPAADPLLRDAGLIDHPNAAGLLEFLRSGGVVIVAAVEVPS